MEFYVAEDFLRYFVSYGAVQRHEHGLCERKRHKLLDYRKMLADKRHEVSRLRTEAQLDCEL